MKTWTISPNGVLGVSEGQDWLPASAEQVYGSIVEGIPVWNDLPAGKTGAAAGLTFSAYPVDAFLVLCASEDGHPVTRFEGQSQLGRRFPLSAEAVRSGHAIHKGTWYPISREDSEAITTVMREVNLNAEASDRLTLRKCLALRRAAAEGHPVVNRLPDRSLTDLSTTAPDEKPRGIAASLYPFQTQGWKWLRFIVSEQAGGVLADEMGLGKTLQVISVLSDPGTTASAAGSLVVAPSSLLENWIREIAKFCPSLVTLKHQGSDRTGSPAELRLADVVITSYETVVRDLSLFKMVLWNIVVLDEAQNIRNPDTRRWNAAKQLPRQVSLAVTGTPIENRLRDLWSIVDFVLPDYLGELSTFEARYDDNGGASLLEPLVSPLILRRRMEEVAQDLPQRLDILEVLELDEQEALAYEAVRAAVHGKYGTAASFASLMKLRQFCAHPALLNPRSRLREYSKFQRLRTLLAQIFDRREKVLVFTTFTAMADRIAAMVQHEFMVLSGIVYGSLPIPDRQPLIDKFTEYSGPAALVLNPRVGGTGLNIAAANHVIQYNPEWNPAIEDQAAARAYRRGQERPVTIRRLIVAGTVEEAINERLQRKRKIAENAIVGIQGQPDDYPDIVAALTRSPVADALTS